MAKTRTQYTCQNCGRTTPRYLGRCPQCQQFDTMVEQVIVLDAGKSAEQRPAATVTSQPVRLPDISSDRMDRLVLPLAEFSRVLGGGIVPGSLILLGGAPALANPPCLDVAVMVRRDLWAHLVCLW